MFARSKSNGSSDARTNALDVPAVEELVRDGVAKIAATVRDRYRDAVITVLLRCSMPSPLGLRQIVGEKRVVARLVVRKLAEHRLSSRTIFSTSAHEAVELGVGAGVVHREAERCVFPPDHDPEL